MKYYKSVISSLLLFGMVCIGKSQILTNTIPSNQIFGSNVLIDASTNFSSATQEPNSRHKGIVIPSTDLAGTPTTDAFEFDLSLSDATAGIIFPTFFDGMIIYNSGTGATPTTGNRPSTSTTVSPGFYYFYNPKGYTNYNTTFNSYDGIKDGEWRPLGGASPKVVIPAMPATATTVAGGTEGVDTNLSIDGVSSIYAIKGTFHADGTSTGVNIPSPSNMKSLYSIIIYSPTDSVTPPKGTVYARELYSYTVTSVTDTTANAITGSPIMSVVYPAGDYTYVMEYLK